MFKFEYKKSLGQNFLKDNNVIDKIVNATVYEKNNLVIEIGPGSGALTKELLKKVDYAILYEIDSRLKKVLEKELAIYNNYELIIGDFLEASVNDDIAKYDYDNLYIVANLPYYVTTPIISKIIKDDIKAKEITLMIQKEVADRISAKAGSKEYGQLTVMLNYYFDIEKKFNVSKNSFIPVPKVDSAVIKMTRKENLLELKDKQYFENLVRDSFRFKRKTIKNNLSNYDLDKIQSVLLRNNFNLDTRSECIPYNVFVELCNELVK